MADSANWSVRASNPGGYAESHGKLTVRRVEKAPPLPKPEPPVFIEPLTNVVEVVAGSSVTLSGRLHPGYPPPQIYWKHDDKLVHYHYHWDSEHARSSIVAYYHFCKYSLVCNDVCTLHVRVNMMQYGHC